ncbi:dephospho-CoA kinase [Dermabacteraceae bacterium P13147]
MAFLRRSDDGGGFLVGLTGGIGCGKSTVTGFWREAGIPVIDADEIARAVLNNPGDAVEAVVARFGKRVRGEDCPVNRAELGRIVFADPAARADLEAIVLPRVEAELERQQRLAFAAGARLVVQDVPLLFEKNLDSRFDAVVSVLAPYDARMERLVASRGKPRSFFEEVIAAQVGDLERIRRSDLLLLNNGDREALRRKANVALERLLARLG